MTVMTVIFAHYLLSCRGCKYISYNKIVYIFNIYTILL